MGRPLHDLTGKRFGRWTVLGLSDRRTKEGALFWHCRCDCGAVREVSGTNMKNGKSTSCGCERIEKTRAALAKITQHKNTFEDLVGIQFGRWTVLERAHKQGKIRFWRCRCSCGTERFVVQGNLKNGMSKSCGCLHKEQSSQASTKHKLIDHGGYGSWSSMKNRCTNPKNDDWNNYGGRGIQVCERWLTFQNFWDDMGLTWEVGRSLDRIDVNGNYEPSNCRWSTYKEQSRNTRRSRVIDTPWGPMNVRDAADRLGIDRLTLRRRIDRGWTGDKLFYPFDFRKKGTPP